MGRAAFAHGTRIDQQMAFAVNAIAIEQLWRRRTGFTFLIEITIAAPHELAPRKRRVAQFVNALQHIGATRDGIELGARV